jgi:hypothetical protein
LRLTTDETSIRITSTPSRPRDFDGDGLAFSENAQSPREELLSFQEGHLAHAGFGINEVRSNSGSLRYRLAHA